MSEPYGPKVRWLRQGARMSGRELSRRVGITPSYLSDIENGRRLPAPAVSDRIADAVAVDRDALWRLALIERLSERDLRTLIGYSPKALATTEPKEPRG
jgi:transcriptional regulator with XRE-family HTH domain